MQDARDYHSWDNVAKTLHKYYENISKITEGYTSEKTKQLYTTLYNNL
jgi:hypothetical protein